MTNKTVNTNKPKNKYHSTQQNYRTTCFFCKYEIKGKVKSMNYKNTCVKICTTCNTKKVKKCAKKYQSTFLDCRICQKAVLYNSSILCSICTHWVHQKCTNLLPNDIEDIENLTNTWSCSKCCDNIFPFSSLNVQQLQRTLSTKRITKPVKKAQCFACEN